MADLRPIDVACPTCGTGGGWWCRSLTPPDRAVESFHAARRRIAKEANR